MSKDAKKKILLAEDEPHMAFNLQFNLQAEGYDVVPAVNGVIALEKHKNEGPFDLVILDVMMPEVSGFEVAEQIRAGDDRTQILMLTALGKDEDRLKGLSSGVDDYITKPFHLEELLLRIRRMVRRSELIRADGDAKGPGEEIVEHGPFRLNVGALTLRSPQGNFNLTALEADILKEFFSNPEKVLSRQYLLDTVWGIRGDQIETRTVDNFIVRLRKYIESDPAKPKFLTSVRGRGYRMST